MVRVKKTRLRAPENARAGLPAEKIADVVGDDGGAHEEPRGEVEGRSGGATGEANGKQERIAGEKKSDQQTGLGEYDPEEARDSQRAAEQSARQFEKPLGVIQRLQEIENCVHLAAGTVGLYQASDRVLMNFELALLLQPLLQA